MHWRVRVIEDLRISNRVLGFATLVCGVMLIAICSIDAAGQNPKDQQPSAAPGTRLVTLPVDTIIKVKTSQRVTSARVKIGDYVQFEVAENVIEKPGVAEPQILIKQGTPIFGRVVQHKNRVFVFRPGVVAVTIDNITAVDGSTINVKIARHQVTLEATNRKGGIPAHALQEVIAESLRAPTRDGIKWCPNRISKKVTIYGDVTCINGRVYISNFTSQLPSAVVAALATTGLVLVKDSTAQAAAAVTLAGQFASQSGFSTILNGSYAEIDPGEIFDAVPVPDKPYSIVVPDKAAAKPAPKKGEVRIQRYHNPTPTGFLETDYFSDRDKYPNRPGQKYNGKVIERYDNKKKGDTMRMCVEGQTIPEGFVVIDRPIDPSICPRENGDPNSPTYWVIMRDPKSP